MVEVRSEISVRVEESKSKQFPGYHVVAIKTVHHGPVSSISKIVVSNFIRPAHADFGKTLEALKFEANGHAEGIAEIFGVQDVRLFP